MKTIMLSIFCVICLFWACRTTQQVGNTKQVYFTKDTCNIRLEAFIKENWHYNNDTKSYLLNNIKGSESLINVYRGCLLKMDTIECIKLLGNPNERSKNKLLYHVNVRYNSKSSMTTCDFMEISYGNADGVKPYILTNISINTVEFIH